ncbi:MAG: shikimate dehydrogenase [Alphaproteobacteria bacterium]|nr:shikimate dehydrogenase [Alphaproteobacteria bacterium]
MSKFTKAAVIGHPVKHSKSPMIHQYWIEKYGFEGSYEAIDIAPETLDDGIKKLVDDGYKGFNVTIPHKESLMAICDEISHNANVIGAVNTVTIEDGKLHGQNTDGFGFIHNILQNTGNFEFKGKRAAILGAGGATRAIASALIGEEIEQIVLLNRTKERAEKLAEDIAFVSDIIVVEDWEKRSAVLEGIDLLVNATSLGMDGQHPLEIDLGALPETALVNDIVYSPLQTQLLKDAQARDLHTVTGIGMLLHQARPAFKSWFGLLPDVTDELTTMVSA